MIPRHDAEQLQRGLDVLQPFGTGDIVARLPLLDEVVGHHPEVALEALHLLPGHKRDLEQVDAHVRHERLEALRHVDRLVERQRLVPVLFVAEVQHQRHHGIARPVPVLPQQLRPVLRAVVAQHAQRHVSVRGGLVLDADARDPDAAARPPLGHVPLDLPKLTVGLVGSPGGLVLQLLGQYDRLPVEQQSVDDVRKHVVIGLQQLLRDVPPSHAPHPPSLDSPIITHSMELINGEEEAFGIRHQISVGTAASRKAPIGGYLP